MSMKPTGVRYRTRLCGLRVRPRFCHQQTPPLGFCDSCAEIVLGAASRPLGRCDMVHSAGLVTAWLLDGVLLAVRWVSQGLVQEETEARNLRLALFGLPSCSPLLLSHPSLLFLQS